MVKGDELGYYAGALASCFCGAQFLSSMAWGKVSDSYGRKPGIIVGTFGAGIGMLVFGMSKTYTQAVCGRIISGLLSGNIGISKCFLTEITDDSNRGLAFSYMALGWAAGIVIGPLVGNYFFHKLKNIHLMHFYFCRHRRAAGKTYSQILTHTISRKWFLWRLPLRAALFGVCSFEYYCCLSVYGFHGGKFGFKGW